MKKLFEIPVYALSASKLDIQVGKRISELKKLFACLDSDMAAHAIDTETFPMRSWDYNHVVGYIRIGVTMSDILFEVFLPVPLPKRYVWTTTKKPLVQNIGANGTHLYLGNLKTNEEIRKAVANMLGQLITDHIPSRFHVDKEAFEIINKHLDYLNVIQDG